jgi:hypothetical protein
MSDHLRRCTSVYGFLRCSLPLGHDGTHETPTGDDDGYWCWV